MFEKVWFSKRSCTKKIRFFFLEIYIFKIAKDKETISDLFLLCADLTKLTIFVNHMLEFVEEIIPNFFKTYFPPGIKILSSINWIKLN